MPTAKTLETELNSFSYNCGGYALGTYNWYIPFNNRDLVSDNAEEDWLTRNNCESYWDLNEKDLESLNSYIDYSVDEGELELYDMLSKINIPKGMGIEDAQDEISNMYYNHIYNTKLALEIATYNMLHTFKDMRQIKSWKELKSDEYGIAYRCSDDDFHFVKYDQLKNKFSHKMGFFDVEELPSMEAGFEEYGYSSDTIYFAKKRA